MEDSEAAAITFTLLSVNPTVDDNIQHAEISEKVTPAAVSDPQPSYRQVQQKMFFPLKWPPGLESLYA